MQQLTELPTPRSFQSTGVADIIAIAGIVIMVTAVFIGVAPAFTSVQVILVPAVRAAVFVGGAVVSGAVAAAIVVVCAVKVAGRNITSVPNFDDRRGGSDCRVCTEGDRSILNWA